MLSKDVNISLKEAAHNKSLRQSLLSDPQHFLKEIGISMGGDVHSAAIAKDNVMFGAYRP